MEKINKEQNRMVKKKLTIFGGFLGPKKKYFLKRFLFCLMGKGLT